MIIKKYKVAIISSIITAIVVGTGVYAYSTNANEIAFTPTDSNWKVDNVGDAINNLYSNKGESYELIYSSAYSGDNVTSSPAVYNVPSGYNKLLLVRVLYTSQSTNIRDWVLIKEASNCNYTLLRHEYISNNKLAISYYQINNIEEDATVTYNSTGDMFMVYAIR